MKLWPKPPPPTGRQRPLPQTRQTPAASYRYRASRLEAEENVGRQTEREANRVQPRLVGRFLVRRFGAVILLVALLASAFNILSLSSQVRVMPLTSSGQQSFLYDKAIYQAAADKLMASSAWNRNKITINTAHFNDQLARQFPELASVSTTIPLLSKRPIVYVQSAPPSLVLATPNGSFILDNTGKALLAADKVTPAIRAALPTVTDESGLQVTLNRQALTTANVNFIQTVVAQLTAKQQAIASLVLPAAASELDVRLAGQPYLVKFNLQSNDARQQVGTLLATQAKLQDQHVTPAEYLDVRLSGRAYYK